MAAVPAGSCPATAADPGRVIDLVGADGRAGGASFTPDRTAPAHPSYYSAPDRMVDGVVRPPRIDLRNETIYLRHFTAIVLAEFVRTRPTPGMRRVRDLIPGGAGAGPLDEYLVGLPAAVERNARALDALVPGGLAAVDRGWLVGELQAGVRRAAEHYAEEVRAYDAAIEGLDADERQARSAGETKRAAALSRYKYVLQERLDGFRGEDWVSYPSDRTALPSYAFPIHSVRLEVSDRGLKLDRDLRLALGEFAPGSAVVACGKLWRSVGVRKPYQRPLTQNHYARCPACGHQTLHVS